MEKNEKIWNRRFILLFITNLLVLATFYASIPIIPIYCQEIGITESRVGIVLTAMSVATILFRPIAGYLLDNFNRYWVYLLFLALFCLSFPAFIALPFFGALIVVRLYMGTVYSVCGSATMTLAGDVLPSQKNHRGHQPLRLHRFHRYGCRPLCRAAGPESHEQRGIFSHYLRHYGCRFDLCFLLPYPLSQSGAQKVFYP